MLFGNKNHTLAKKIAKAIEKNNLDALREGIKKGADVNYSIKPGISPTLLMLASREGNVDAVKCLIDAGADVNAQAIRGDSDGFELARDDEPGGPLTDGLGVTAIMLAVSEKHEPVVEELLASGADPNKKNEHGATALMWAVWPRSYHVDHTSNIVQALLARGADVKIAEDDGTTILQQAVWRDDVDVVGFLLDAGADPNLKSRGGSPPILGASARVSELLLRAGADPNARDSDGCTALMRAAQSGDDANIDILLRHGADPTMECTANQYSAAAYAKVHGHRATLRRLRQAVRVYSGLPPDAMTTEELNEELVFAVEDEDLPHITELLATGAQPDARNGEGEPILLTAIEKDNKEIAALLVESGSDINSVYEGDGPYSYTTTPLLSATEAELADIVRMLLERGADTEAIGSYNRTPLIIAAMRDNAEIVQLLLKHGANITAADEDEETALSWATTKRNERVIKLLKEAGAEEHISKKDVAYQQLISRKMVESEISELPIYYWAVVDYALYECNESDPSRFANEHLHISCPVCGLNYNSNSFEIGYLASLGNSEVSGLTGMYGRCKSGYCPNPNCTSRICNIELVKQD